MDQGKYRIRRAEVLSLPIADAEALLRSGDGDAALLYIYILRRGGELDTAAAARELGRSDRDVLRMTEALARAGLLETAPGVRTKPLPAAELPEYRAEDVVRPTMESREFRDLVDAVQQSLGRILSSPDLKKLFGIYDELFLPADVILLLIEHCKEEYAERYGPGKNVGFAFVEKEAFDWFHREILTYEQAESWLSRLQERKTAIGRVRRELGLMDRPLSKTERTYLEGWIELGFPAESILMAADTTVTNTGGLKWKYMDGIVQSWQRMGLHTPEEIEKYDKKPGKPGKRTEPVPSGDDSRTIEQMKRLREKMRAPDR